MVRATTDEVIRIVGPHLGERLLLVLPDEDDDRLRVIDGGLEARIWRRRERYAYEIASVRTDALLAKGEAATAYAALERSIPLLLLLHEGSSTMQRTA